ncbi:MAG: hypothetical protein ACKVOG_12275 [Rhodoglobus sp.]
MSAGGTVAGTPHSPLRRAHRSLSILIVLSILASGGVTSAVTSAPSPLSGIGFALSALVLAVAGTLAARIVIALERVRRQSRAPVAPLTEAPLFNKLERALRRRP